MNNGYGAGEIGGALSGRLQSAREYALSDVSEVPKATPVGASMQHLQMALEGIDQAVMNLARKMEPVLYSEPPTPVQASGGISNARPRSSSLLGGGVDSVADRLEQITERINALYRRCEL